MPEIIDSPTPIPGVEPKRIEEYIGRASTGTYDVSIARMVAPGGWTEPGQRPEFDEFTVVVDGCLRVESDEGVFDVDAGKAVVTRAGEWVRYSTPHEGGAEYLAVCLPAFSPEAARRDD